MSSLLDEMGTYLRTRAIGPRLAPIARRAGDDCYFVCGRLVNWLARGCRGDGDDGVLALDMTLPFPRLVLDLVRTDPELAAIFVVTARGIELSPKLNSAEQILLAKRAFAIANDGLHTTRWGPSGPGSAEWVRKQLGGGHQDEG